MKNGRGKHTLGITFLALGLTLTVAMAASLGVAFIGVGMPFAVLGIIFLRQNSEESAERKDK